MHDRSIFSLFLVPLPAVNPFRGYNIPKEIFLYYSILALKLIGGIVTNFHIICGRTAISQPAVSIREAPRWPLGCIPGFVPCDYVGWGHQTVYDLP